MYFQTVITHPSCKYNFVPCHIYLYPSLFCSSLENSPFQIEALLDSMRCKQLPYYQARQNYLYLGYTWHLEVANLPC